MKPASIGKISQYQECWVPRN